MWKISKSSIPTQSTGLISMNVLCSHLLHSPTGDAEALFLERCPNSSHPGLVARAAAAQPILIKMESLKCWSMEKDIKDFIISSQNSQ